MKTAALILLVALTMASSFAAQNPRTAEALMKGCEMVKLLEEGKKLSLDESAEAFAAAAYVDGYIDGVAMLQRVKTEAVFINLSKEKALSVHLQGIAEFIRDNPGIRKEGTARVAVMLYLRKAFPAGH